MEEEVYYRDVEPPTGCVGRLIGGLIGLLLCLLVTLCSCSKKTMTIEDDTLIKVDKAEYVALHDSLDVQRTRIISLLQENNKRDSVFVSHTDSTWVFVKGDTVRITNYVHDIEYRENKEQIATINCLYDSVYFWKGQSTMYKAKVDSVANISHKEVLTKEVPVTPWYIKLVLCVSFIVNIVLLLYLAVKRIFS